uniref:Transmembrane protein n=1 Tax=Plectus sambesii TaxID=2011161 RepID=A0A914VT27_9BILA
MNPQMLAAVFCAIILFHSTAMASVYLPNSFFKLRPLHPSARKPTDESLARILDDHSRDRERRYESIQPLSEVGLRINSDIAYHQSNSPIRPRDGSALRLLSLSINMHYMLTGTIVAVFIAFTVAQDHEAQKRGLREFYFLQQVGKNAEPAAWRDQLRQLRAEVSEVAPLSATLPPVDNTPSLPIPTSDLKQMIEKDDPILARAEFKRTNARAANTIRRIVARLVALGIGRWGQR